MTDIDISNEVYNVELSDAGVVSFNKVTSSVSFGITVLSWSLSNATDLNYSNTTSGLSAENVQTAIDEVSSTLGTKADVNHNHDDLYYGKTYIDDALDEKLDTTHADDTTIHYTQDSIVITSAQVSDFQEEVSNNVDVINNSLKVSADGSVTTHNDVTDAGSGKIITDEERDSIEVVDRLRWADLVTTWTQEPTEVAYSGSDGSVLEYVYGTTTYYRFVPDVYDSSQDAFYTTFNGSTLSNLITSRGNSI